MNSTGVEITAGLGGFLVLFFLAIALILLGMDLNRRLRRLKHQEELRLAEERLMQERRAREAEGQGDGPVDRADDAGAGDGPGDDAGEHGVDGAGDDSGEGGVDGCR